MKLLKYLWTFLKENIEKNIKHERRFDAVSKNEVKIEALMDLRKVADYLESILKGIRSGKIIIQTSDEMVTVRPEAMVEFELEAVQKKDREKIEIKIAWDRTPEPGELRITSKNPAE